MNKAVVSYAILAVDVNSSKGYLDYFLPFVSECLRKAEEDIITTENVSADIFREFGLTIPNHVIKSILNKLKKQNYIYYDKAFNCYKANREKLNLLTFKERQEQVLFTHSLLLNEIISYNKKCFNRELSFTEAEKAFEDFLSSSCYSVLFDEKIDTSNQLAIAIASFIADLEKTNLILFQYYVNIVVGHMVATSIYYSEFERFDQKFKDTALFLDTTFIIFALGYSGEVRQKPCLELIQLLKENNAQIKCFKHTIDEVADILEGCIYKMENGVTDNFGTVDYFIRKRFDRATVMRFIGGLEKEIERTLRAKIVEKPDYTEMYNIDEMKLREHLAKHIRYSNEYSLERDIQSIHSIFHLRRGHQSRSIEHSKAIFVTTNEKLTHFTNGFYWGEYGKTTVSPIINDYVLTTLLWIKQPNRMPDLPKLRVIADCYAALQPKESLLKSYLEKIYELKTQEKITEDDYWILRTQEAKTLVMEHTLGDEEAITYAKVQEIIEITREKISRQQQEIIIKNEEELTEFRLLLQQSKQEKEESIKQISEEVAITRQKELEKDIGKSEKIAKGLGMMVSLFLSVILFVLMWVMVNNINIGSILAWVIKFISVLLIILGFWGISASSLHKKMCDYFQQKVYRYLYL